MSRDSGTVSIAFSSANRAVALIMMDCNGKGNACLYFISGISKSAILLAGNDNEPSWSDDGATLTLNSTDWNNVTVISAGEPIISFAQFSVSPLTYQSPCEVLFISNDGQFGIQITDKATGNVGFITIKKDSKIYANVRIDDVWGTERLLQLSVSRLYVEGVSDVDNPPNCVMFRTAASPKGLPNDFGSNAALVLQQNPGSEYAAQLAFSFGGKIALRTRFNSMNWQDWKYLTPQQHSVSQYQKHIGLLTEANYRGNAWITLGEGDDSRGIAWSDTELSILRGGVVVSRIKLNKVEVSTSQISPELS